MKKICHVTSAHPVEDGRIFRRACISSAKAGYETYLVERGDSYDKENVHIVGIGSPKRKSRIYRITTFARRAFKQALVIDADLYQLHDPELLPFALILKKKGKKVIFDSHENYPEQMGNKPYLPSVISKCLAFVYKVYTNYVFRKIDGIVYPAKDYYYEELKKINSRIAITNNVPWLSELYYEYDDNKKEEYSACYTGGISKERGVTQIIKACYKAGCKLYLAGRCNSEEYLKEIQSMKEFECVEYLGFINRSQLLDLYKKVEIGLSLLLDYGQYYKGTNLPTKVYEYMSMGIPFIANNSDYNLKIVNEYHIGLCVDPMNIDQTAEAIKKLHCDKELRLNYGNNGRRLVFEKYNWDVEQQNLINLYKKII